MNDYQLISYDAFSSAIYRLTNKHITIEESTNTFHNFTLCIYKVSITTTLEDIEEGLIYRDVPIKNLHKSWWASHDFNYIQLSQ